MKYFKVLQGLAAARKRKPVKLVQTRQPLDDVDGQVDNNNDEIFTRPGLEDANLEPEQFVVIVAVCEGHDQDPAPWRRADVHVWWKPIWQIDSCYGCR